jgi:hypothetical protein
LANYWEHKYFRKLSTSAILLVCNTAQNKVIRDHTKSSLDCTDKNLSEVESTDSDNEVGKDEECGHKRGIS